MITDAKLTKDGGIYKYFSAFARGSYALFEHTHFPFPRAPRAGQYGEGAAVPANARTAVLFADGPSSGGAGARAPIHTQFGDNVLYIITLLFHVKQSIYLFFSCV